MPLRALDGIHDALQGPSGVRWACFIIGAALLVILLLLVHVLVVRTRRRRRLRASWQQFAARMVDRQLSRREGQLLRELAERETPWRPLDVAERIEVFERAVHRYLKAIESPGSGPEPTGAAAAQVRSLRGKLGFEAPAGAFYFSTRQLPAGLQVHLTTSGADSPGTWAKVKGGREDFLELVELESPDARLKGRRVEVVFFQGTSAFSFEVDVVAVDTASASCLLTHSLDVRSAGMREFHRVAVGKPITFRAAWEEPRVRREGTLRDLSAGGLGLLCPCLYERGEELVINISPARCLGEGGAPGVRPIEDRQIGGRIVETRRTRDGRCVYHVEFSDISESDQQYVFGLVRRLELRGRAAEALE